MICLECQTKLPEGSRFCKECGQKIDLICPELGADCNAEMFWISKHHHMN
jgi:hypothetical protein